ncbi:MAG: beta-lactamase family protein [Clostridia bacterium]|nr:beta-lactamase family protein [Clostridia bacterium]
MNTTTASKAGVRRSDLEAFMNRLRRGGVNMHSVLMARRGEIFFEAYWEPFTRDTLHRMYSVTKSFVSVAIGCLLDEGKLSLDDHIADYFPDKLPEDVPEEIRRMTIRHMLTMSTCFGVSGWLFPGVTDRVRYYFSRKPDKPTGTIFTYDSNASYVMGVLVERLSGMPLMDYLRKRVFDHIGGFENAYMLKTPDGTPWSDSALMATPRDLLRFVQFVMNRGSWHGKQLMSADYLAEATRKQVTNNLENRSAYDRYGYGYQFWMGEQGSFYFSGMGGQYAVCVPEKDFVFVCTGANQLNGHFTDPITFDALFRCIVDNLSDEPLPEEEPLRLPELKLPVVEGMQHTAFADEISGKWYVCDENPMGITRFKLEFPKTDEGLFTYVNAQGEKQLPFGLGRNVFCKFPQEGYHNDMGNVQTKGFYYDCAVSAAWHEERKLLMFVQVIDRYFGQMAATFAFRDKEGLLWMTKSAEQFMNEYVGRLNARREA